MRDTDLIIKAFEVMSEAHDGQVDKGGNPYLFHPISVALKACAEKFNSKVFATALLHDVVEDTEVTFDALVEYGFPSEVLDALKLLIHDKSVPYMEYVKSLSVNLIARTVKMADLENNMDLSRIKNVSDRDCERVFKKYIPAYVFLKNLSF